MPARQIEIVALTDVIKDRLQWEEDRERVFRGLLGMLWYHAFNCEDGGKKQFDPEVLDCKGSRLHYFFEARGDLRVATIVQFDYSGRRPYRLSPEAAALGSRRSIFRVIAVRDGDGEFEIEFVVPDEVTVNERGINPEYGRDGKYRSRIERVSSQDRVEFVSGHLNKVDPITLVIGIGHCLRGSRSARRSRCCKSMVRAVALVDLLPVIVILLTVFEAKNLLQSAMQRRHGKCVNFSNRQ